MVTCNRKIRVQHIQLDSGQQNADGLPAGGKLAKRGRCEGVCQGGRGERDGWLSVLWTGVSPGVTPITKPTQSRRHSNHEANSVSGKAHAETACSRRDGMLTQRRHAETLMRAAHAHAVCITRTVGGFDINGPRSDAVGNGRRKRGALPMGEGVCPCVRGTRVRHDGSIARRPTHPRADPRINRQAIVREVVPEARRVHQLR